MNEMALLGLNEHESNVYRILMVSGQLSKGEIRFATGLQSADTDTALASLSAKKLIREVPGLQGRYAALLPIGSLKTEIEASIQLIDILGDELKTDSAKTITDLKAESTAKIADFKNSIDAKQSEINSAAESITSSLESDKASAVKSTTDAINEFAISSSTDFQNMQQGIVDAISAQTAQTSAMTESRKNALSENLQTTKQAIVAAQTAGKADIPPPDSAQIESLAAALQASTTAFQESAASATTAASTTVNQSIDALQTRVNEQLQKVETVGAAYQTDVKSLGTALSDHSEKMLTASKATATALTTEFQTAQQETIETLQSISSAKTTNADEVQTTLTQLQTNSASQKSETLEALQSNLQSLKGNVDSFISSTDVEYSNHLNTVSQELTTNLEQQLDALTQLIETQFAATLTQTKQQLGSFNANFAQQLSEVKNTLESAKQEKVQGLKDSVETTTTSLQNNFAQSITNLQTHEHETFTSAFSYLSTANAAFDEQLSAAIAAIDALISKFNTTVADLNMQSEQEHSAITETVSATVAKNSESFATNFTAVLSTVSTQLKEELQKMKTAVANNSTTSATALQSAVAAMQQAITESSTKLQQAMQLIHQQVIEQLHTAVDKSTAELNALADKSHDQNAEHINKVLADILGLESSLKVVIGDAIQTLGDQFTDVLGNVQSAIESQITKSYSSFVEHQTKVKTLGSDAVAKSFSLVAAETDGQIATVQQSMNAYNTKYGEVTGQVTTPISALAKILGNLEGEVESTATPLIKTTHVIGKDAILEYITDFIGRIKSKATLLVPSISMIDDEAIMKLRSTTKIDIISHIDEVSDREWIEKMHNATPNVTLRTIVDRIGGGSLPDFIGCEREGEEILLGTIDEGNNDYVAIASASEYFVKILGNIVIADYSRGKSKRFSP